MKLFTTVVFTLCFLVNQNQISSAPISAPMYSASVTVYDQSGQPLAGVPILMIVETTSYTGFASGATNAAGFVYLSLTAPGLLDDFTVMITGTDYVILSSQNTSTSTANTLYPRFDVGVDIDGNGIIDDWELPLAQKFCPKLFQEKKRLRLVMGCSWSELYFGTSSS